MPIDPSIAMGVRPLEVPNPLNQYAQLSQIQNAQNQNALAQYQLAAAQRAEERQNRLPGILSSFTAVTPIEEQVRALQSQGFIDEARKLAESHAKVSADTRAAEKAKIENLIAKTKMASQIFAGVSDQASYDRAKTRLASLGIGDISELPDAFDPKVIEQHVMEGLDLDKRLENVYQQINAGGFGFTQAGRKYGTPGVAAVPGSMYKRTPTPGEVMTANTAAQRLAFDQQKFEWEKANPGFELKESEDGTIYGVNKRTLQSFPVSIGAPAAAPGAAAAPEGGAATPAPTPLKGKGSALTEAQSKAVGFAARAKEADEILNTTSFKPLAVATKQGLESVYGIGGGLGMVANQMMSENDQKVDQAQRNFVNAVLRQESGAAISESEFQNARKQYFPQPGDSKKVIEQKAANRKTVIKSLETVAGPGMRKAGATTPTTPATPGAPAVGSVQSGYRFKGGDPADASNWEKL